MNHHPNCPRAVDPRNESCDCPAQQPTEQITVPLTRQEATRVLTMLRNRKRRLSDALASVSRRRWQPSIKAMATADYQLELQTVTMLYERLIGRVPD